MRPRYHAIHDELLDETEPAPWSERRSVAPASGVTPKASLVVPKSVERDTVLDEEELAPISAGPWASEPTLSAAARDIAAEPTTREVLFAAMRTCYAEGDTSLALILANILADGL